MLRMRSNRDCFMVIPLHSFLPCVSNLWIPVGEHGTVTAWRRHVALECDDCFHLGRDDDRTLSRVKESVSRHRSKLARQPKSIGYAFALRHAELCWFISNLALNVCIVDDGLPCGHRSVIKKHPDSSALQHRCILSLLWGRIWVLC